MANFFYFDQNNQKQGPVSEQQLKELAAQQVINPYTPMETDDGHKGVAGQIPGLFAAAPESNNPAANPIPTKPSLFTAENIKRIIFTIAKTVREKVDVAKPIVIEKTNTATKILREKTDVAKPIIIEQTIAKIQIATVSIIAIPK